MSSRRDLSCASVNHHSLPSAPPSFAGTNRKILPWLSSSTVFTSSPVCSAPKSPCLASTGRALLWSLGCALSLMFVWPLAAWTRGVPWFGGEALAPLASSWALGGNPWLGAWIAPVWIACGAAVGPVSQRLLHAPHAGVDASDADRPRRDLIALCLLLGTVAIGALCLIVLTGQPLSLVARTWAPGLLVQTAPLAAVFAARGLVRAERDA